VSSCLHPNDVEFLHATKECLSTSFEMIDENPIEDVDECVYDAPPSSLCDPKRVKRVGFAELVRNLVSLPASSTKRGRGVVLEALGLD